MLRAQTNAARPLHLERFGSDLGLSQNLITCIVQDRQGFLWLGTKDGLNKFDGYRFTVYRYEAFDSTSLSNNFVTALCEDSRGAGLWIGTQNGLNLFDRTTEIFHRCPVSDSTRAQGLSHAFITDIRENPDDGAMWVATTNGLNKLVLPSSPAPLWGNEKSSAPRSQKPPTRGGGYELHGATYMHLRHDPNDPNSLSNNLISRLAVDGRGVLWVEMEYAIDQVVRIAPDRYHVRRVTFDGLDPDFKKALQNNPQNHYLAAGQNGAIWIGVGPGLLHWDAGQSKFTCFKNPAFERTLEFSWQTVAAMYEAPAFHLKASKERRDGLWIGTYIGLARFEPATNHFSFYRYETGNPNRVPESGVGAFLQDAAGVLWLGSKGNGLFRYDPQARRFAQRRQDGRLGVWQGTSLRALFEIPPHGTELWIGAANGHLYRMNRLTGEINLVPAPRPFPAWWGVVAAMRQDQTGALWIGGSNGLFRLEWNKDRATQTFYFNPNPNPNPNPISQPSTLQEVFSILEDRDGEIWFGSCAYLMRWDRATNGVVRYRYASEDPGVFLQNTFMVIHQDRRGVLWLGTSEGLLRFNREAGTFKSFTTDAKNISSLSHNVVRTICDDPDDPENILWIGTAGGGLNRFDMRTETFTHFTAKDGLPDMVIYAILGDGAGNLWMSTNRGLSRFNPATRTFKNFDVNDGLQDNEFNSTSYFKSPAERDGELFFGGINGFNAFYPEDIRDNAHVPPVVFTGFQLFNQPVSFKDKNSVLIAPINEMKALTLSHDQNVFSFEFAALDFTDPAKNRYRYMMENFDAVWRENGTNRSATYTNLNPGEYVFRVQGSNNDGVWNEKGASIKIIITPPWWQTWWAYVSYAAVIALALYQTGRNQIRKMKQRGEARLREEKQRAMLREAELRAESAELREKTTAATVRAQEAEKELANTKVRHRIASDLHDDVGSNLSSIALLSDMMKKRAEVSEKSRGQLGEIHRLARLSGEAMREIVWFVNPENDRVEKLLLRMKEAALGMLGEIECRFHVGAVQLSEAADLEFKRNVYLIYKEMLQNVVKHARATSVEIVIDEDREKLWLSIADNGVGFDEAEVALGNGLKNMHHRASRLGGVLEISSRPQEGTRIKLTMKIP